MADEPVQEQIGEPEPQEPEAQPEFDFSSRAIKAKIDAEREPPVAEPEPEPEPVEDTRPRDDKGRFAKERPGWLPDNYKTVEDYVRANEEAQQLIGRLGQEVGDLRQQVQQHTQPRYSPDDLDEWFAENPTAVPQVAENARQHGDAALFNRALNEWYELAPRQAAAYERRLELSQVEARVQEQLQQTTGPLTSRTAEAEFGRAMSQFAADKPDFDDLIDRMSEAAESSPTLARILGNPDLGHNERLEAIEVLYYKAGGRGNSTGSPPPAPRTDKTTVGVATSSSGTGVTEDKRDAAVARFKKNIIDA